MPTYRITAPDGTVYRVSGDGTEQEALAGLQAQLGAAPKPTQTDPLKDLASEYSAPQAALIGAGKAVSDLWEGGKQLVGMGRTDAERAEAERLYAPLKAASPIATGLGESAPYMAAGGLAGVGRGLLGTIGRQAASSAVVGAGMEGSAEERAKKAAVEGGWGALGGLVGGIPGALAQRAMRPEVTMMREAGVVPTVGQTLGGQASKIEESLGSIPLVGHMIDFARDRARREFNVGALNRALEPIGGRATSPGHAGVGQAQTLGDEAYNAARDLAPSGLPLDPVARQEIANLRGMLPRAAAETETDFNRFYNGTFKRRLGPSVGFEPVTFKQLDAEIGEKIRDASKEETKTAFEELQRILRSSAARANPEYAAAQSAADTSYAMMKRVEDAANRGINNEGVFTPGQLSLSARKLDKSADKRASARGESLMLPYASAGQTVLGDRVANSGSPVRLLTSTGALGGAAMIDPTILAGALAALAMGSRPGQQALNATLRGGRYVPSSSGQVLHAFGPDR